MSGGISPVLEIAATGHVAGALLAVAPELDDVVPVQDADRNYTREVRFKFMDRWYSLTVSATEVPS